MNLKISQKTINDALANPNEIGSLAQTVFRIVYGGKKDETTNKAQVRVN